MADTARDRENVAYVGAHKQCVNRIIEPYCHINVVCSSTEWNNFYALRRHKDADPTMRALAETMWQTQNASTPKPLQPGEWHLPYTDDMTDCDLETSKKVSVARCARTSYRTHDGRKSTIEEDLALYERLVIAKPPHMSPAEHQATPDVKIIDTSDYAWEWERSHLHGNLNGWVQYRRTLPGGIADGR